MADAVEVDPAKLTATGNHMLTVRDKLGGIVSHLNGAVGTAGPETWGTDSFGKGFADGDDGYVRSRTELLSGAHELVISLGQFGQGMIDAANKMTAADHQGG
ncbi:hypothetical protein ACWDSJ_24790 [Nocardia sp. NPDC003482]